jgi:hypothetical protein
MSTTDIALPSERAALARAEHVTQTTAVEQARAVAEVQAAVTVAQSMPRDMGRAVAEMRDSCGRLAVATRAFYRVPNRGEGPSVHLARELARIWGNIDYGVRELRRDETLGVSEVQAFAWDQQTNVRSTRTFQVPHQRMVKGARVALVDLGDVYLNNQNIGARAVRECIFTALPTWFVDEAVGLCRRTLEHGEGVPLAERIDAMVKAFGAIGVTPAQLEAKIGRRRAAWEAGDVASMTVAYRSIQNGEVDRDEEFPPTNRVSARDVVGDGAPTATAPAAPEPPAPEPRPKGDITQAQQRKLHALLRETCGDARDLGLQVIEQIIGRPVESTAELTKREAGQVIDVLEADVAKAREQKPAAPAPDPADVDAAWGIPPEDGEPR